jgi:hypothetical protein
VAFPRKILNSRADRVALATVIDIVSVTCPVAVRPGNRIASRPEAVRVSGRRKAGEEEGVGGFRRPGTRVPQAQCSSGLPGWSRPGVPRQRVVRYWSRSLPTAAGPLDRSRGGRRPYAGPPGSVSRSRERRAGPARRSRLRVARCSRGPSPGRRVARWDPGEPVPLRRLPGLKPPANPSGIRTGPVRMSLRLRVLGAVVVPPRPPGSSTGFRGTGAPTPVPRNPGAQARRPRPGAGRSCQRVRGSALSGSTS